ncbi:hypothetical protein ACFU8Q_27470 [Streptomyces sp. NPDC057543]|uniref:hypothetical protein n=1 Tax=Streptomyces sp. NPDC057543 TaxID=3346163 RepID=UPI0036B1D99D
MLFDLPEAVDRGDRIERFIFRVYGTRRARGIERRTAAEYRNPATAPVRYRLSGVS